MSNVRQYGAAGDGQRDDTEAIEHALRDGDGLLEFPRGIYRISRPVVIRLKECGLVGVRGSGGTAKLVMAGAGPQTRQGLIELVRCRRINVSGVQILGPAPYGLFFDECSDTLVTGCTILDTRAPALMQAAIRWQGTGSGNLIGHCRLGVGAAGSVIAGPDVRQWNNLPG